MSCNAESIVLHGYNGHPKISEETAYPHNACDASDEPLLVEHFVMANKDEPGNSGPIFEEEVVSAVPTKMPMDGHDYYKDKFIY